MLEPTYNWKRFWCPRSGHLSLADGGYLADPDDKWSYAHNPELVTFTAISQKPCLILLGEPGIGKSRVLEVEQHKLDHELQDTKDETLSLNLRSFKDENRLVNKLFESQKFKNWLIGKHQLYIFLDSFDEGLLRIDTLAGILADEFNESHISDQANRLYLRIACRTAVWPSVLEKGLRKIWDKESVGVYELAPLRRKDVIEALQVERIDTNSFLKELYQKNIVSLAIKPITLRFLINTYRNHNGQFPENKKLHELYLDGCRCLCAEPNDNRLESKLEGNLDIEQRLIVAARVAAVTVFANRFAIWTYKDQGDVPEEDVLLRKLCGGHEICEEKEFEINKEVIAEVLDTGLFSSRGEKRMGWAHQTYAEFLAAWYLVQHQISISSILEIFTSPEDPHHKLVPQLHETAAWLASMRDDVFQEILKTDPDVLLHSDLVNMDDSAKEKLVESLLKLFNEEKLIYSYRIHPYKNLKHSRLLDQIQPFICDITKSEAARMVAINIATACHIKDVQESLADITLDSQQPPSVRIIAADALSYLGDETTKARLKPLALAEINNETEESLKGYSLQLVWPNHITVEEIFESLTQPLSKSIGGAYADFVARELAQHLQVTDLKVALRWLAKQKTRQDLHYPFRELSDRILFKAWNYLENKEILKEFTKIVSFRLQKRDKLFELNSEEGKVYFDQLLSEDDEKRRQLIEEILSTIPESEQNPLWLSGFSRYSTPIVLEKDLLWLIERLQVSDSEHIQKLYAKLLEWKLEIKIYRRGNPILWQEVDALLEASQNNEILKEVLLPYIKPVDLDCWKAEKLKAKQEQAIFQELQQSENYQNAVQKIAQQQRIIALLNQFESGQVDVWWYICQEMALEPTNPNYSNDCMGLDITEFPGWKDAEERTKTRIIEAAKIYIEIGDPRNQEWLGTNEIHGAFSGFKALQLLLETTPRFIDNLSRDNWKKWTPIILDFRNFSSQVDNKYRQELIWKAYLNASDEFIRVFEILMDQENKNFGYIYINRIIHPFWDKNLEKSILTKISDDKLTAKSLEILLKDLLVHQNREAKRFAESLISLTSINNEAERKKAIVAARTLMLYTADASWSVIWPIIQQDSEFGKEVLESVSYAIKHEGSLEKSLKENYIADLYIFLIKQYPDHESIELDNSQNNQLKGIQTRIINSQDSINMWRDYIPQRLKERGTPEACEALRKIMRELPQLQDQLQGRLLEAEALARRKTWQAPSPEKILHITSLKPKKTMKTILFLASSPIDAVRLRLDEEIREIDESLRRANKRDQFTLEKKLAVRPDDLRRALLDTEPQIVHFSGHGSGEDGLALEDNKGKAKLVTTEALANLFEQCADHVECVLLNACYSEVQADAIVEHIDYVIGMNQAIGDEAAIKFSQGFYDALGAGKSVGKAYNFGRIAIQLESIPEHLIPVLKKKKGI